MAMEKQAELEKLLANWEEVYKKGLLSFWLLLLLHEEPSYAYQAARELGQFSQGTISADENSIYRALSRFESLGIVTSETRGSDVGPDRKYYSLSAMGEELLRHFIRRNLLVFNETVVQKRMHALVDMPLEQQGEVSHAQ
jgi:PadR family transcriptional regulator PadR